jgi:hypothetical protein
MTKEERMEKARQARAANAARRSQEVEDRQLAKIESVWDRIPAEKRLIFDYIARQIRRRPAEDIAALRETRRIHFSPYGQLNDKEDTSQ